MNHFVNGEELNPEDGGEITVGPIEFKCNKCEQVLERLDYCTHCDKELMMLDRGMTTDQEIELILQKQEQLDWLPQQDFDRLKYLQAKKTNDLHTQILHGGYDIAEKLQIIKAFLITLSAVNEITWRLVGRKLPRKKKKKAKKSYLHLKSSIEKLTPVLDQGTALALYSMALSSRPFPSGGTSGQIFEQIIEGSLTEKETVINADFLKQK